MFTRTAAPSVRQMSVRFGAQSIPAEEIIERGKVHLRLAWNRSITEARIVLTWDHAPLLKGNRIRVRVEVGEGAFMQCLGETYTTYRGVRNTLIFAADYGRLKGLQ